MTKVTFRQAGNHFMFAAVGHCGHNKGGADLVCAAVSTLSQSLLEDVRKSAAGEVKSMKRFSIKAGDVAVDLVTSDEGRARMEAAFELARNGFYLLEKKYPECVAVGCIA